MVDVASSPNMELSGTCVMRCKEPAGLGSIRLEVRQNLCLDCNRCSIAIACPDELKPDPALAAKYASHIEFCDTPSAACENADVVVTDVWASMGEEQDAAQFAKLLAPYQVNRQLMSAATKRAIFLHCLPAHRGEEVSGDVIDGPQSAVWQEAGNRLHAQKALLEFLLL